MEKQNMINCKSKAIQYAYVHADKEGRWYAYGESARLFRLMLKERLMESNNRLRTFEDKLEPAIDIIELDFSTILNFEIALCSDTALVVECPLTLLNKAS